MNRTFVHVLLSAALLLFSVAAQAHDSKHHHKIAKQATSTFEDELAADLQQDQTFSVSMKKINKDSNNMMDDMFVDREKGQTRPKSKKQIDDGMQITVRYVKR